MPCSGQLPDPVPSFLLGQLGTDSGRVGRGVGTGLLKHALERCVIAAALVGGRALMVNAFDVQAAEFWRRRGFIPARDDLVMLFRSIAAVAAWMSCYRAS